MQNSLKGLGVAFILILILAIAAMYMNYNSTLLQLMNSVPYGDKFAHFFVIGTLTFFVNILLDQKKTEFFITPLLLGSVLVFALVSIDEVVQMFVAHRNCELLDFVANLGFILGKSTNNCYVFCEE